MSPLFLLLLLLLSAAVPCTHASSTAGFVGMDSSGNILISVAERNVTLSALAGGVVLINEVDVLSRLSSIEQLLASQRDLIAAQNSTIGSLSATVEGMRDTISTQEATIAHLRDQLGDANATALSSSIVTLGVVLVDVQAQLSANVSSLSSAIAAQSSTIAQLRAQMDANITSLSSSLSTSFSSSLSTQSDSISRLQAELDTSTLSLTTNVTALSSTIAEQNSSITQLQGAVNSGALASQASATAASQLILGSGLQQQISLLNISFSSAVAQVQENTANSTSFLSSSVFTLVAQGAAANSNIASLNSTINTVSSIFTSNATSLSTLVSSNQAALLSSQSSASSSFSSQLTQLSSNLTLSLLSLNSTIFTALATCNPCTPPTNTSINNNNARDCSFFPRNSTSGIYTLSSGAFIFCDFNATNSNQSWTLLATFEQPNGVSMANLSTTMYNAYFTTSPIWIQGNAEARPLSPEPLNDGAFHVRSVNWSSILIPGRFYQLRQRFFKGTGVNKTRVFDVTYRFVYNGFTLQDSSIITNNRIWVLTNRTVLQDTTGITWDTPSEQLQFWLPFTQNISGSVYTACGGYDLSSSGCDMRTGLMSRRFGNAGIMGSSADSNSPAAGWAPFCSAVTGQEDIVYVDQATNIYGNTTGAGGPVFLSYYISPVNIPCPPNSTGAHMAAGCTCAAGFNGTVTPISTAPFFTTSCTPVPCPANSVGVSVFSGCTCVNGANGSITPSQLGPNFFAGSCTPVACPAYSIGANLVSGCTCSRGTTGSVTATSISPLFYLGGCGCPCDCALFPRNSTSGTYTLPSGSQVYCDFNAPNNNQAWTLLATFEQPNGVSMFGMAGSMYNAYFASSTNWIRGNSEARPLSPEPLVDGGFHIRSVNWASMMVTGKQYQLRQRIFKGSGANKRAIFDVAYTFTYNGFTLQDSSTISANRIWVLSSRNVLQDTSGIMWNTPNEQVQFWLPFTQSVTGAVFTACSGYELSPSGCGMSVGNPNRRYGNAGIMGSAADSNDPAASWAPMAFAGNSNTDIIFVQQAQGVYGNTAGAGGPNFLSYYIAPV